VRKNVGFLGGYNMNIYEALTLGEACVNVNRNDLNLTLERMGDGSVCMDGWCLAGLGQQSFSMEEFNYGQVNAFLELNK
jgi:hypothetical protein